MSNAAPSAVILVRSRRFRVNPATAADNAFQADPPAVDPAELAARATGEMDAVADALRAAGVTVHVFDDDDPTRPDSVFPNNWLSTHPGGMVAVHPMFAPNRRHERRGDVLEMLKAHYRVQTIVDYSGLEADGIYLEGTGALVIDHESRVAYMARSHRADQVALERFCADFAYEPMAFDAFDEGGLPVYHTNVLGWIGTRMAMLALEMIPDASRREAVRERMQVRGREVLELTERQVGEFAGNAIELTGWRADGSARPIVAMSARARRSLRDDQVAAIERSAEIVAIDIPTLELSGGSVRCMIAGIHLDPRPGVAHRHGAPDEQLVEAVERDPIG